MLVGLALVGVVRYAMGADTRALWAAAVLLVPVAPAAATLLDHRSYGLPYASIALVGAVALLAGRIAAARPWPTPSVSTDDRLHTAAVLSAGFVLGVVPVLVVADGRVDQAALGVVVWVVTALGAVLLPRRAAVTLAAFAVVIGVGVPALLLVLHAPAGYAPAGQPPARPAPAAAWLATAVVFAPAALIAALAAPAAKRRGTGWQTAAAALASAVVALVTLTGREPGATAFEVLAYAFAVTGTVAGWRCVRDGRRWSGTGILLVAALWLGSVLALQPPSWLFHLWWLPPTLLAVVLPVLAHALPRRPPRPTRTPSPTSQPGSA